MSSPSVALEARLRASAAQSLWRRLLIPSLSDLLFLFVIVWSFLAGENGWLRLLMDSSVALQIRAGDLMMAEHRIPAHDIFSFAYPGQPWYVFEWLSELVFGAVHGAWGLKGVVLLTGVVLAGTIAILFRSMLARGANCLVALLLTLVAANAATVSFTARPQIFTLALLTISAWLIDADRRRPGRPVWLLLPLSVLWTNLHGGFFILLPMLGLLVAGCVLEQRFRAAYRYAGLLFGCSIASFVNPYGARFHQHVLSYLADPWVGTFVKEFQSPSFRSETLLCYMVLLFLALGACGLLLRERRIVEVLWIVFFAYCSLTSVRHVPLFLVVTAPIIAVELSDVWSRWVRAKANGSTPSIVEDLARGLAANSRYTSVWIPAALLALCWTPGLAWPADFPAELFPARIAARHANLIAGSRIFTTDQWADYLIYKNYPRQRVFMDDQHQYYSVAVRNDFLAVDSGARGWKEILDRYGVNAVLCPSAGPLASLLRERPDWPMIEEDRVAALFTRRGGN